MLERRLYCEHPPRHEYILTERGRDFRPVVISLQTWGNRHFAPEGLSVVLVDKRTGAAAEPILVDRLTGQPDHRRHPQECRRTRGRCGRAKTARQIAQAPTAMKHDPPQTIIAQSEMSELNPRTRVLLHGPIVPTLLRMAWPNILVMLAQASTGLIETWWVSHLGTAALTGMAVVFPGFMMMQMLSAGAMGGGISSAIARALGGRRHDEAEALVMHALVINAGLGLPDVGAVSRLRPTALPIDGRRGTVAARRRWCIRTSCSAATCWSG